VNGSRTAWRAWLVGSGDRARDATAYLIALLAAERRIIALLRPGIIGSRRLVQTGSVSDSPTMRTLAAAHFPIAVAAHDNHFVPLLVVTVLRHPVATLGSHVQLAMPASPLRRCLVLRHRAICRPPAQTALPHLLVPLIGACRRRWSVRCCRRAAHARTMPPQ
jgi:hypothetical protein